MKHDEKNTFEKTAIRISNISIISNAILSLLKFLAGVFAHSGAMISDAVHSASDVISSVIVIVGIKISAKSSDEDHPYGHERFECVAAIILSILLCITGLFIGHTAVEKLTSGTTGTLQIPGVLALIAAIVSIIVKETMYWYTKFYAKKINSGALMADAWHHRSDALSSVGALVGIGGARLGYLWLEPVASLVICVFIIKAAYDIFTDSIEKMVDHSCSPELQNDLLACAMAQPNVLGTGKLQTRQFGNKVYVDLEILADASITLRQSSEISEQVHHAIEQKFPEIKHIMVRVSPK